MGWFEYFKHSHKTTFPPLDGWIRMRLRSILRKRQRTGGDVDGAGIINAGPMHSLLSKGCSLWSRPMLRPVNPLGGEPPTGEPDAGDPPVRFGGRGGRNQSALPQIQSSIVDRRSSMLYFFHEIHLRDFSRYRRRIFRGGRHMVAYLIESPEGSLLLDCGSTILASLNRHGLSAEQIDTVLLSHFHGDHFGGLPFLFLHYLYIEPRVRPLRIVGPPGVEDRVRLAFRRYVCRHCCRTASICA